MNRDKSGVVRKKDLPNILKQITSDYVLKLQEKVSTPLADHKLNHVKDVIRSFLPEK